MLNKLKFNVHFSTPSINRSVFSGEHDFKSGMTVISGKNESGKSLIIEMIRYALWGTKALRATTSDYKTLSASLIFNKDYRIERDLKGTDKVYFKDDMVASGTKPVNTYIENLLGYGMDVFDVSNACLQGKVNDLSKKTPAERKRMIDKTIGLDMIDDIINNIQTKERSLRTEFSALESTLQDPIEPTPPVGYRPTEEVEKDLREAKEIESLWLEAKNWLKTMEGTKKPEPIQVTITEPLSVLEEKQRKFETTKSLIDRLKAELSVLERSDHPQLTEDQITDLEKQWSEYLEYQKYLTAYPSPDVSEQDLEKMLKDWEDLNLSKKIEDLEKTLQSMSKSEIKCHNCGEMVCSDHEVKLKLQSELKELQSKNITKPEVPSLTIHEINIQKKRWETYNNRPEHKEVQEPLYPYETISVEKSRHEDLKKKNHVLSEIEKWTAELGEDLQEKINQVKIDQIKIQRFEEDNLKYQEYILNKTEREDIVSKTPDIQQTVTSLQQLVIECKLYEQQLVKYENDMIIMNDRRTNIEDLKLKISKYENCRSALKALKPKVKSYLVPSLNKVASNLLFQITNGERRKVEIDEEFNIKIDNQKIETLSGSGETAANLALRISLGTVLTNKALSVFLGDEIDAAMDKSRVDFTAECLQNLKKTIDQIIVVSHREPEADHYIKLGETKND